MARRVEWWVRQAYFALIPSYPIGYLILHGFRGDDFWAKMYVNRSTFPAPESLKDLVESEMDKLGNLKNGKVLISLTDHNESRVYGGFFLRPGVELQFPINVSFDDVEQARRLAHNIELDLGLARNRRKIEVNSKIGDEIISRMMLSDLAKMFVVQRELQIAKSGMLFSAPIFAWMGIFGAGYAVVVGLSKVVGIALAVLISLVVNTLAFNRFYREYNEYKVKWADERAVDLGADYLQGAREYFNSTMKFNRLLRIILGEEGERNISRTGDRKLDRFTLSARLENVEKYWKLQSLQETSLNSNK